MKVLAITCLILISLQICYAAHPPGPREGWDEEVPLEKRGKTEINGIVVLYIKGTEKEFNYEKILKNTKLINNSLSLAIKKFIENQKAAGKFAKNKFIVKDTKLWGVDIEAKRRMHLTFHTEVIDTVANITYNVEGGYYTVVNKAGKLVNEYNKATFGVSAISMISYNFWPKLGYRAEVGQYKNEAFNYDILEYSNNATLKTLFANAIKQMPPFGFDSVRKLGKIVSYTDSSVKLTKASLFDKYIRFEFDAEVKTDQVEKTVVEIKFKYTPSTKDFSDLNFFPPGFEKLIMGE